MWVFVADLLIKNGRVWDGERFFFADVLTEGQYIVKIAPHITENATYVYDATDKIVSAGFVDAHVHMRIPPVDRFGLQAEMSCLPFGVTAAADAGRNHGERILFDSFAVKNVLFVGAEIRNNSVNFDDIEDALARYGDKAIGIKVYFDTEMSEVSDISPLVAVCRFASERNLRVMVHCSGSPVPMSEILSTLNASDILTHAFHGGGSNAAEDDFASIKAAQKQGVVIDTGFAGYVHTDFAIFEKAIRSGVLPDTISSDITKFSAYTRGGRYGMTMCMSMARHMGMTEEEIFRAITSTPARVLGKSAEWGRLEAGRTADIAVLEYTDEGFSLTDKAGNHIESKNGYRCVLTVSDGLVVYRH